MTFKSIATLAVSSMALALTACGGGGGGANTPVGQVLGGSGGSGSPDWVQGQFEPSATFKSRCEVPRSGTDDRSGSLLHEKHWLRSWSDETYLWYNEITDVDPANSDYPTPIDYFDILRTTATTASGAPRDKFHFTRNTEEYQELVNSGASAGYGARFALLDSTPPDREALIALVEAGSPAATAGFVRGTEILEVDGTAIADGDAAALNAGLFPADVGESHSFLVRLPGNTNTQTITVTSDTVERRPVHTMATETLPNGDRVGYMLFNTFGTRSAEEALFNGFRSFQTQGIDHLVLDLRYNGGGFLDISAELGYMIAGSNTTNRGTCSASESLINGLEGIDVNVVLIGTTTCGKPYGFYATDNCGTTFFTIQFRGENDKGFGDYADGFSPFEGATTTGEPIDGCILSDDFSNELGNTSEALYGAALNHIQTGTCPVTTASADQLPSFKTFEPIGDFASGDLRADPRLQDQWELENSRILNRPE